MTEDTDNTFDPEGLTRMEAENLLQAYEQLLLNKGETLFPVAQHRIIETMRVEMLDRMLRHKPNPDNEDWKTMSTETEGFVVILKDGTYGRIGEVLGRGPKPLNILLSTEDLNEADVWPLLQWESRLRQLKDRQQVNEIAAYLPAIGRRVVTLKRIDEHDATTKAG